MDNSELQKQLQILFNEVNELKKENDERNNKLNSISSQLLNLSSMINENKENILDINKNVEQQPMVYQENINPQYQPQSPYRTPIQPASYHQPNQNNVNWNEYWKQKNTLGIINKDEKNKIQNQQSVYQPQINQNNYNKQNTNFEFNLGKYVFPIIASVFVFIGLIIFAVTFSDFFTPAIKATIMFIISFIITGVGVFNSIKKEDNKFALAISACGFGALYITLFTSRLYFNIIGDIPLYVLLLIWVVLIILFAKKMDDSLLFRIIGHVGLLFSILLGIVEQDDSKFLLIIIYMIIGEFSFYFATFKKDYEKNILNNVFTLIAFASIAISSTNRPISVNIIIALAIAVIVGIAYIVNTVDEDNALFGILNSIYLFVMFYAMHNISDSKWMSYIILVIATGIIVITEFVFTDHKNSDGVINSAMTLVVTIILLCNPILKIYTLPLVIFLFVIGFYEDSRFFKTLGFIEVFIYMFAQFLEACFNETIILYRLLIPAVFIGITIALYKQYNKTFKIVNTIFMFIACILNIIYEFDVSTIQTLTALTIFATFSIIISPSFYCMDWETHEEEREFNIMAHICNGIAITIVLMYMNSFEIGSSSITDGTYHFIALIIGVILCAMNTWKNITEDEHYSIYVSIKISLFIIFAAVSFTHTSAVISIICIIISIINIIVGFVLNIKGIRLTGLILSFVSIAKLVLFDISYQNSAGKAISYIICGLLFFGISWIYYIVDKKMKE